MLTLRNTALLALLCCLMSATARAGDDESLAAAEGLWAYTDLVTRDGQSLPLTGVFLISGGMFLQQSIFNSEPFASAGSMAHAGPYWAGGAGLRLTSEQTLSLDPQSERPLQSAGSREHDLKVEREGDALTLTFGGGTSTVQTFSRLGDAQDTRLFRMADGALALSDGYFILVSGNDTEVVSAYGRYEQEGSALALQVIRWAESDGKTVLNFRDRLVTATLQPDALVLEDGRRFPIAH